jgi:hypothetical protein
MSKYSIAKAAIEQAVNAAAEKNVARDEVLLAILVSVITDYQQAAGRKAARTALTYELDNLGGEIDTVFLRSR